VAILRLILILASCVALAVSAAAAHAAGNSALSFPGTTTGSNVAVPDSPAFHLTANFTVSADVRWDGTLGYLGVVAKPREDDGAAGTGWTLVVNDGTPCFGVIGASPSGNRLGCAPGALTTGVWTHIQGAYTGMETLIWVNGILVSDTLWPDFAPVLQGPTQLLIGREFITDLTDRAFHGAIDNVRVSSGLPGAGLSTVAYYPFSEGLGRKTADASGHGHGGSLSLTNRPSWITNGPCYPAITSFWPTSGRRGTPVTINVDSSSAITGVFFNGVAAGFKAFSGGVVAYVPATATSGPIRVQNACGSIAGDVSFVVS
jgi:hypothetical protein